MPKKSSLRESTLRRKGIPFAELLASLLESADVPFGAKSTEESRGVFPPLETIDNFVEHANEAISRVFRGLRRDLSSGFTTSEGAKSATTEDAKYEALEIMGGKFGGKLFHVQAAIADLSVSREEVARRAYVLGLLIGRLQAREHENRTVAGIRCQRGGIKGGQARDKSEPAWQSQVEEMMKGNGRSYTDVCDEIATRSGGVAGRTVRRHTSDPRRKIRKRN